MTPINLFTQSFAENLVSRKRPFIDEDTRAQKKPRTSRDVSAQTAVIAEDILSSNLPNTSELDGFRSPTSFSSTSLMGIPALDLDTAASFLLANPELNPSIPHMTAPSTSSSSSSSSMNNPSLSVSALTNDGSSGLTEAQKATIDNFLIFPEDDPLPAAPSSSSDSSATLSSSSSSTASATTEPSSPTMPFHRTLECLTKAQNERAYQDKEKMINSAKKLATKKKKTNIENEDLKKKVPLYYVYGKNWFKITSARLPRLKFLEKYLIKHPNRILGETLKWLKGVKFVEELTVKSADNEDIDEEYSFPPTVSSADSSSSSQPAQLMAATSNSSTIIAEATHQIKTEFLPLSSDERSIALQHKKEIIEKAEKLALEDDINALKERVKVCYNIYGNPSIWYRVSNKNLPQLKNIKIYFDKHPNYILTETLQRLRGITVVESLETRPRSKESIHYYSKWLKKENHDVAFRDKKNAIAKAKELTSKGDKVALQEKVDIYCWKKNLKSYNWIRIENPPTLAELKSFLIQNPSSLLKETFDFLWSAPQQLQKLKLQKNQVSSSSSSSSIAGATAEAAITSAPRPSQIEEPCRSRQCSSTPSTFA